MSNYKVFNDTSRILNTGVYGQNTNGTWQVIKSNDNYSLVVTDQAELYGRLGSSYSVTTATQTVASNGFLDVQISNPTGSGKSLHIVGVTGGATTNTTIDLVKNGTFAAAGTTLTPRNINFGFSDSSIATVKWITQATDPTTGGVLVSSLIQIGGAVVVNYNGSWVMPSNTTLVMRLVNNTNQSNPLSIGLQWWEETP